MKTIIDSEQTERLKEVCDKYGVKLPFDIGFHKYEPLKTDNDICGIRKLGEDKSSRIAGSQHFLSLADLLEMLPRWINERLDRYSESEDFSLCICCADKRYIDGDWVVYYSGDNHAESKAFYSDEPIDALYELFIWVIENGYYRGE